jgi:hypothetical protein
MALNTRQSRNVPPVALLASVRNGMVESLNDRYRRRCTTAASGRLLTDKNASRISALNPLQPLGSL